MRHRNTGRQLSRSSSHRKALLKNLCNSLLTHEVMKTTLAKAKELRRFVEPIITTSKTDSLAARRHVFDRLRNRDVVVKLFAEIGPRYEKRPGGYVRVLKCGYRAGDNAPMALIELVDREFKKPQPKAKKADVEHAVEAAPAEAKAKKAAPKAEKAAKKPAKKAAPKKAESKKPAKKKTTPKAKKS